MRVRLAVALLVLSLGPTVAEAKDVFVPIAGTVGVFRTDARVFNPSHTKSIAIQAWRLPVGNVDNSAVTPISFDVPARQTRVLDDVVSTLFGTDGIAGLRFSSVDDFAVTARIYARLSELTAGTYGQFEVGVPADDALAKGAILQLESSDAFRSNVGFQNTDASAANLTLTLYDKNNQVVKSAPLTIQPRGVVGPTDVVTLLGGGLTADLSDCWLAFESNRPIAAYGSVVDAVTSDATFVPAVADSGVKPPVQATKEFNVSARQFEFTITPVGGGGSTTDAFTVNRGDKVILHLTASDTTHGFSMFPYVTSQTLQQGKTVTVSFDAVESGEFTFFCTIVCGVGHTSMSGTMTVNP